MPSRFDRFFISASQKRIVFEENGGQIEYLLKPSRRCKRRIILRYDEKLELPVLTVPYGAVDLQQADEFVQEKQDYIRRQRDQVQRRAQLRENLYRNVQGSGGVVLYRGELSPLLPDPEARKSYVERRNDAWNLRPAISPDRSETEFNMAMLALLKGQAKVVLGELMEAFRGRARVWPASWRLSSARTRWGCCTARDTIRLSWRLIFLDDEISSYVIAHELAHLVHLNHSKAFWEEVERLCPNWRALRAKLKAVGQLPDFEKAGQ